MKVGNMLTRIHLWIGEHLGLTRYTSCWSCKHARVIDQSPDVCRCVATPGEWVIACCSEAVWCPNYKERKEMRFPITAGHDEVFADDCEFTFPDELGFDVPGKLASPIYVRKDQAPGDTSDGWHTFNELYEHRTILFASLCNYVQATNAEGEDLAFKSLLHSDGTMYDGMFIAGLNTRCGWVTYHCEAEFWNYFDVPELERAPEWDGATPDDGLRRLCDEFITSFGDETEAS